MPPPTQTTTKPAPRGVDGLVDGLSGGPNGPGDDARPGPAGRAGSPAGAREPAGDAGNVTVTDPPAGRAPNPASVPAAGRPSPTSPPPASAPPTSFLPGAASPAPPPPAAGLPAGVAVLVAASVAPATRRAYTADWARFTAWCQTAGTDPLRATDAELAGFLAQAATAVDGHGGPAYATASIRRWVTGINQAHTAAGRTDPPGRTELVRRTLAGIARTRAIGQNRRRPLHLTEIATIVATMRGRAGTWPERVAATRDTLILTVGMLGALRGAELVALRGGDITLSDQGAEVTIRRSKTDQQAIGMVKALRRTTNPVVCPLCALHAWRHILDAHTAGGRAGVITALTRPLEPDAHGHVCGAALPPSCRPQDPVVRWLGRHGWPTGRPVSPNTIRDVVLTRAAQAGMPDDVVAQLGAHSLRAGFVTDAYAAGATDGEVMRQTGHRSLTQVRAYQRDAPHIANAVTRLDLS